eukprot:10811253-Lingulodinium_polyedra.AAC.1
MTPKNSSRPGAGTASTWEGNDLGLDTRECWYGAMWPFPKHFDPLVCGAEKQEEREDGSFGRVLR